MEKGGGIGRKEGRRGGRAEGRKENKQKKGYERANSYRLLFLQ